MAPRIRLLLAFGLGLACQPTQGETTSFASVPTTAPPPSGSDSSAADTSGGSDGGASQGSSGGGASDASSSADPSVGTGDTTLLYDVGPDTDTATGSDTKPAGCEGKIDLLFVLSRDASMKSSQEKLLAAFPGFIATIQAKSRILTTTSWSSTVTPSGA
ncbi:MAG: hypothetical protein IPK80_25325 [Nannocystis sp.]|nr:hypothetical protein [Nannocystis sp.]